MAALDELIRDHAATGRPPMRLVGQMGWVFSSPPGIEQLVAYEASVNEVLEPRQDADGLRLRRPPA